MNGNNGDSMGMSIYIYSLHMTWLNGNSVKGILTIMYINCIRYIIYDGTNVILLVIPNIYIHIYIYTYKYIHIYTYIHMW